MPVVKLRGLPWSCTVDDIIKFLQDVKIAPKKTVNQSDQENESKEQLFDSSNLAIYLTTNAEGRPSGEAFIEVIDDQDVEVAMMKNNASMGMRYIEVFRSNNEQLSKHIEESANSASNWSDPVVRLRGLPYGCNPSDISAFFDGLHIAYEGIMMVIDFNGRFNGEAFVQFETLADAQSALEKHKQKIQNRYIEIFRSNRDEMSYYASNSNKQNSRNSNKMRNNRSSNNNGSNNYYGNGNDNNYNGNGNGNGNRYADNSRHGTNNRSKPYDLTQSKRFSNNKNYNNSHNGNNNDDYNNRRNTPPMQLMSVPQNLFFDFNNQPSQSLPSLMTSNFNHNDFSNNNNNGYSMSNGKNHYNSSSDELNGQSSASRTQYGVKMRGLPYTVTEDEIRDFFAPLEPVNIIFLNDKDNRRSGACEVDFASHIDACEAMKYDKKYIGTRYIELFLLSGSMAQQSPVSSQHMSLNSLMKKSFSPDNIRNNNRSNRSVSNPRRLDNSSNKRMNQGSNYNQANNNNYEPQSAPPLMAPVHSGPPHQIPSLFQQQIPPPPGYNNNVNDIMNDMAKKMFESAVQQQYDQYQQIQTYQQPNQNFNQQPIHANNHMNNQPKFNSSQKNFNPNKNRRF